MLRSIVKSFYSICTHLNLLVGGRGHCLVMSFSFMCWPQLFCYVLIFVKHVYLFSKAWPADALLAVATKFLGDIELPEREREACIEMCQEFHISTQQLSTEFLLRTQRHTYVTPTSYLELISTFKDILSKKRK